MLYFSMESVGTFNCQSIVQSSSVQKIVLYNACVRTRIATGTKIHALQGIYIKDHFLCSSVEGAA